MIIPLRLTRTTELLKIGVALGIAFISGCSVLDRKPELLGDDSPGVQVEDQFSRALYGVAGIGPSRLEPDTSDAEGWDPNDRVEPAGQLTVGADLTKHLSVEVHSADLGSAGLSPRGRINYHINGASALVYAGGNRHRYRRQGLIGYGRVGVGVLENSPVGDVPYQQINGTHVLFGAGLEYMTPIGIGLRAEGVAFDTDVQYAQVGLMYRTGGRQEKARPRLAELPRETQPTEQQVIVQQPVIATALPAPVVEVVDACAGLGGLLEGISFSNNSAGLSLQSARVLDQVASTLEECPGVDLELTAHTDANGSEDYNQVLAAKRAESVMTYLRATGLKTDRLIVNAIGETAPVDTNDTAEGRARNRRVELIAR